MHARQHPRVCTPGYIYPLGGLSHYVNEIAALGTQTKRRHSESRCPET